MSRVKIDLPEKFSFSTLLAVRITDLNYGGHVGNDRILALIHEARMQFFLHWGFRELDLAGVGSILSDAAIEFKNELFYGDILKASVTASNFSKVSFDLFYKLEKITSDEKTVAIAYAKTGIVMYDYSKKRVVPVPEEVRLKLAG